MLTSSAGDTVMSILVTLWLAASTAAAAGDPPPWPESLKCAAHVQAWAELARDANSGMPEESSFDAAIFWSMAAMEAARRDKVESPAVAEAAQKAERARVKPLLAAEDPAAAAVLAACVKQVPPIR
jgi:hypothetical protein